MADIFVLGLNRKVVILPKCSGEIKNLLVFLPKPHLGINIAPVLGCRRGTQLLNKNVNSKPLSTCTKNTNNKSLAGPSTGVPGAGGHSDCCSANGAIW